MNSRSTRDPQTTTNLWSKDSRSVFGRLLVYVKPYRWYLVLVLLVLICTTALTMLLPLIVQILVDTVLIQKNTALLNQIALALVGVFLVQAIFNYIDHLTIEYVGQRVVANIRMQLYSHLQSLSLSFYDNHRTGDIVSCLTNDVSLLQQAITTNLIQLLIQAMALIAGVTLLFVLNWQLTLIILAGVPIVVLLILALGFQIRKTSQIVQQTLAQAANVLEETVASVRIVKSFARQTHEIARFSNRIELTFQSAIRRARTSALLESLAGFVAFSAVAITIWFGGREVLAGRLTPGELVAYLLYTLLVSTSLGLLAALYAQFQTALGAGKRIFDLLDTAPAIVDRDGAQPLPPITNELSFENVSFGYHADTPVLHNISFQARTGQMIALVGPSGAGKSTLVNLIPRFFEASSGRIMIDGHDIRDVTQESLSSQIGIVPQETLLFAQSVADNIRYGKLDATQAEIEAAAKAANAHDFIVNSLPDGYETLVGERGVKLSGGQRQRIAIARAILKDPRILILDEATSSLDSESEQLIQEALERLMCGRTSFVIAHRLSTITSADWILVFNKGRVVEQGTHYDLLQHPDGIYRRLYSFQFAFMEVTV
jgi:ATP-binding cassette, subfamily B, bacterial MsbA